MLPAVCLVAVLLAGCPRTETGGEGPGADVGLPDVVVDYDGLGAGDSAGGNPDGLVGKDVGTGVDVGSDSAVDPAGDSGPVADGMPGDASAAADVPRADPDAPDTVGPEPDAADTSGASDVSLQDIPPMGDSVGFDSTDPSDVLEPDDGDIDVDVDEQLPEVQDVGPGEPPPDILPGVGDCETADDCAGTSCAEAVCVDGSCGLLPVSGSCDDLNPCTSDDSCQDGVCVGGANDCIEDCGNGVDDDLDGAADCADDDCLGVAACLAVCGGQETISCGQQIFDSTSKVLATQLIEGICGATGTGGEVIYRFEPPADLVSLTATITSGDGFVELVTADGDFGICGGLACLAGGVDTVGWEMEGSLDEIFVVVDTVAGDEGPYQLDLACEFPVVEYCSNLEDDDGDDLIDCEDPDCDDSPLCGAGIEDCDNGVDDDGDGDTDCDDDNCVGTLDCVDDLPCDPLYELICGSVFSDVIDGVGTTQVIDSWACGVGGLDGPEVAHSFTAQADAQVTVAADGAPPGTMVLIIEDAQTCAPADCLAAGEGTVTFAATAGQTYALVVDEPAGVVGGYELSIACLGLEVCLNGYDDDGDGDTDCEDLDCYAVAPCLGQVCEPSEIFGCGDVFQGTLSAQGSLGMSGCGPMGAGGEAVLVFSPESDVNAVITTAGSAAPELFVLDGAGLCDTAFCIDGGSQQAALSAEAWSAWYVVVDGSTAGDFEIAFNCEAAEAFCGDGLDDDGDGLTDCADQDCLGAEGCAPACPTLGTLGCGSFPAVSGAELDAVLDSYGCAGASNLAGPEAGWALDVAGFGEGVDVRVSLWDPASTGATLLAVAPGTTCDPMSCIGVADEDGALELSVVPGLNPWIVVDQPSASDAFLGVVVNCGGTENICFDGFDGDGDGLPDCADLDCIGQITPCPLEEDDCSNGTDDDLDQLVDCFDDDCFGDPACAPQDPFCAPAEDLFCDVPLTLDTDSKAAQPGPLTFDCPEGPVVAEHATHTAVWFGLGEETVFAPPQIDGPGQLLVLESTDGISCDPGACIASSEDEITLFTELGQAYMVVLAGTSSGKDAVAELALACEDEEESCVDGLDDDADGYTDCLDPACDDEPICETCLPLFNVSCGETLAFNALVGGGTTLGVHDQCGVVAAGPERAFEFFPTLHQTIVLTSPTPGAVFHVFTFHVEGCFPDECVAAGPSPLEVGVVAGAEYVIVVDTEGDGTEPMEAQLSCAVAAEICDDGEDNDLDWKSDCADPECAGLGGCPPLEDCDTLEDEDLDGDVGCDDTDCKLHLGCESNEICDNEIDDDFDGWTDCKDLGCIGAAGCPVQEVCNDGADNDDDGWTDCADYLCTVSPLCQFD